MKRNIYIISALVLLIAVVLFLKFGLRSHLTVSDVASASNKLPSTNAASQQVGVAVASPSPGMRSPSDAAVLARIAAFQAVWADANSRSLDFYARVIDQNGQPVVGAKVTGYVMTTVGFDGTRETPHYTQTDSSGNFQFSGLHGQSLGIIPAKVGYELNQRIGDSWTEDYKASPNNRVTIVMWKLKGPEPMIHTTIDARIPYDGQSTSFDLSMGHKSKNGNFKVSLMRNPLEIRRGGPPFDWNSTISAEGGGLVETSAEYQNLAPETGYQPVLQFSDVKDDPHWTRSLTKTFYVHLGNGSYGRVSIDLVTDSNIPERGLGVGIEIESWINPSGSRNLEFDPSKQINP